jgi:hypothetical protein
MMAASSLEKMNKRKARVLSTDALARAYLHRQV